MGKVNWGDHLNLEAAVKNLRVEIIRDWHQDPWGWPELGYLFKHEPNLVYQHCNGRGIQRMSLVDVPKENWSTRPAVVLDIIDRVVYQSLVDNISLDLIHELSPNVFGWRLPAIKPRSGHYSHNDIQWQKYRSHLTQLASKESVALRTDLVSFFSSITIDHVQDMIQDKTSAGPVTHRLSDWLDSFQLAPNRSGLPQRSLASSVIANMFLGPLDDVLTHHARALPRRRRLNRVYINYHSFARWMDDIWLFSSDAAACRRAQVELQAEAHTLGLHLNSSKTDVLEGDQMEQVYEIEHSGVDSAIDNDNDFTPLEELVDKLLEAPEKAGRPSIRFVSKRMRDHSHKYRLQDMLDAAKRMPHAADSWARLFKENFTRSSLQDWYLDYASSDWGTFQWSVAHFGRMFPSNRVPRSALRDFFSNAVRDANTSLPLLAIATQRLCAWDQKEGRAACRDAYKRASSPHARRVLSLAALETGESRATVRRWLGVDKENYPTLQMLEYYNFAPVRAQEDFAN